MIGSIISYIHSILTRYAYSIIPHRHSIGESISGLSARDRQALLCDVSDCLHWHLTGVGDVGLGSSIEDDDENAIHKEKSFESGLNELETLLQQSRASLNVFGERERFVGLRIQRYRELLERRNNTQCEVAIEIAPDKSEHEYVVTPKISTQSKQEQYAQDEMTLQSVEQLHKNIIAEVEVLRRRITDLEEKKHQYVHMREACEEFVLVAAAEGY